MYSSRPYLLCNMKIFNILKKSKLKNLKKLYILSVTVILIGFGFHTYINADKDPKSDYMSYKNPAVDVFSKPSRIYHYYVKMPLPELPQSLEFLEEGTLEKLYFFFPQLRIIHTKELASGISPWMNIVYPPYIYPPLLAYVWHPFSKLSHNLDFVLWKTLLLFCLFLLPLLSIKFLRGTHTSYSGLTLVFSSIVLSCFYFVIYSNFYWGQVNLPIIAGILFAVVYHEKYPIIASFLFAMVVFIKMSPALLILYFLIKRNYKFIFYSALFSVFFIGFTILLGGLEHWIKFFQILPNISLRNRLMRGLIPTENDANFSLRGFIYRITPFDYSHQEIIIFTLLVLFLFYIIY